MAGFVKKLLDREEALSLAVSALNLLKYRPPKVSIGIEKALGALLYADLEAAEEYPPYSRSTRDGYAVQSPDTLGASQSSPVFLSSKGEVPMGAIPQFTVGREECALIHTGGALPAGADSVVMLEDIAEAGAFIEVRRAVQKGENMVVKGEEYRPPQTLLPRGARIDSRAIGVIASFGIANVETVNLKVGIISSGDEIVDITSKYELGKIRDVNSWTIASIIKEKSYTPVVYGIAPDNKEALQKMMSRAMSECQVVLISGGSSVSERDFTPELLQELPPPGLIVRGLNVSPGKPTLIAGSGEPASLVIGLPGHPYSCFVMVWSVVLPLLSAMTSGELLMPWRTLYLPVSEDIFGRTGIEEFIPCRLYEGFVSRLPAKSAYIGTLRDADGFIRLGINTETLRKGAYAEVCLW